MALPVVGRLTVFNAIAVTTTTELHTVTNNNFQPYSSTLLLEVVGATTPSWTLDIQGKLTPDGTYTAVDYVQIWQAGAAALANSQLSITDTTRRFYLVPNCPQFIQLIATRTTGTLTVYASLNSEPYTQWLLTSAQGAIRATGDVAHDAVDAGNPLKMGGKAQTGLPTAVANLDRVDAFLDEFGSQAVKLVSPVDANDVTVQALNADLATPGATTLGIRAASYLYFWDETDARWLRAIQTGVLTDLASAARTASTAGTVLVPVNAKGYKFMLDITAVSGTTPTLDVAIQELFSIPAVYVDMPSVAFAQKTATGRDTLTVLPGIAEVTTGTNRKFSQTLASRNRSNSTIAGTTPSFTYSISVVNVT